MRSTTLAFSALCSLAAAASSSLAIPLHGWSNATEITSGVTVTGYTTYCPVPTVVTVTTCSDHKCAPETITASEATTITITGEVLVPTTIATSLIGTATTSVHHGKTVLPTGVTVTGYTTYCPSPTVFTISTCNDHKCAPAIITVSEASTLTFTGECVVPSSVTSEIATSAESTVYTTGVTVTGYTTYCPSPTVFTISTCNDHKCAPAIVTVSEASTVTFTGECVVPSSVTSEIATSAESTVYTTGVTVTGYTTYCPSPTVFTISTCNDHKCAPAIVTVSEASTVTFTGECVVPTSVTSEIATSAESTVYTTGVTVTGYTTYCPSPTVFTISTCNDHKCAPAIVTVSEASTVTFTGECVVPTSVTSEIATSAESTVYTTGVTVTGYTTYCPSPTEFTISTCNDHKCAPSIVTVSEASTLTFTGECVVPTSVTSEIATSAESTVYTTGVTVTGYTTYCPSPTEFTISTCNDNECTPAVVTVSEASTLTFTGEYIIPTTITSAVSKSASIVPTESTVYTTGVTVTGYTTYCPTPTVVTLATCSDSTCVPEIVTVSEASRLTFSGEYVVPTTITSAVSISTEAEYTSLSTGTTVYTTGVTVTGYTTYYPFPTVVTASTCSGDECAPEIVTVSGASTLTFTGEYLVPSSVTSAFVSTLVTKSTEATSAPASVTIHTGGAGKAVAGAAGFVGLLALLI